MLLARKKSGCKERELVARPGRFEYTIFSSQSCARAKNRREFPDLSAILLPALLKMN